MSENMDDAHVIKASGENEVGGNKAPDKDFRNKKVVWIVMGVVAVSAIALFSYFLGVRENGSTGKVSATPTISPAPTPTPNPTPEQDENSKETTLTPTKKPTSTPTASPTPTPVVKVKVLSSSAELDGFRSSNNGGNSNLEIRAGRNENLVTRGFASFSLADIPSGSTITEATLRLYQAQIIGNPYGVGGSVKIDHLNFGDSLDSSDYSMAALLSNFSTLTSNATLEWKDAPVTDQLKDDIANARPRSQYRIHFSTENIGGNVTGDFAYFESADNNMGTGNTPQLIVKYY